MTTKHKVLLIGSGLMTPPLIDYLLSFNDTHISVVSNLVEDARALAKKAPKFMDADFLDVTDVSILDS
jgi:alpha-aminoadipic semialdehyde synthase